MRQRQRTRRAARPARVNAHGVIHPLQPFYTAYWSRLQLLSPVACELKRLHLGLLCSVGAAFFAEKISTVLPALLLYLKTRSLDGLDFCTGAGVVHVRSRLPSCWCKMAHLARSRRSQRQGVFWRDQPRTILAIAISCKGQVNPRRSERGDWRAILPLLVIVVVFVWAWVYSSYSGEHDDDDYHRAETQEAPHRRRRSQGEDWRAIFTLLLLLVVVVEVVVVVVIVVIVEVVVGALPLVPPTVGVR